MISAYDLMLSLSHWDCLTDVDFTDQALLFYTDLKTTFEKQNKARKQTDKSTPPITLKILNNFSYEEKSFERYVTVNPFLNKLRD